MNKIHQLFMVIGIIVICINIYLTYEIKLLQTEVTNIKGYTIDDRLDIDRMDADLDIIFKSVKINAESIITIRDYLLR